MSRAVLVKLRPAGPWRIGPDDGGLESVGLVLHSDSLYSAVTHAMLRLGMLADWIGATASHPEGPQVCISSAFPFHRDTLLVTPPRSHWPPPPSPKLRYKGARFVPLSFIEGLLAEQLIDEDRWLIDGPSECLLPSGKGPGVGPFRSALRSHAAVDRLEPGRVSPHASACLEFAEGAGLWFLVSFHDEAARDAWAGPVRAALRLLADSGFGGRRSLGWGRADAVEITEGALPSLVLPSAAESPAADHAWWFLSLFAPAPADRIDWQRGSYSTLLRSGRLESDAAWGALKTSSQMVAEGSVLVAPDAPRGTAHDVAPAGFPHPVFRAGFAVAIPIPWRATA
jgi:CRISPR type III-A-associated RAMP protein Csm4